MKPGMTKKETDGIEVYNMNATSQCPLVARRFDECYCKNMNSQKIASVVHYCMRNFEACEIYKKKMSLEDGHRSQSGPSDAEAIQPT